MDEILDLPDTYPSASIQSRHAKTDNDDSLQGDVSYLSSSAGSYDSVVQNYDDQANFHEAPSSGIIKGMSWAQVVSRNPQAASTSSSQPTESHLSDLTTPTSVQHSREYRAMDQRLTTKLSELRQDMKKMLEKMEATEQREAARTVSSTPNSQSPQEVKPNVETTFPLTHHYPTLGNNGYTTNYFPHPASPGYNYQEMY
jgi:predicted RNase H-like nuclease (RuvC/YqgF family)